jgi:hypothetical protein
MRQLLRRVRHVLRHQQFESELREEIEFHRQMKQQELEESLAESAGRKQTAEFRQGSLSADVKLTVLHRQPDYAADGRLNLEKEAVQHAG